MNPEELKNIWAHQPSAPAEVVRLTPELVWRLADKSTRFEKTIFWRDTREWLATIIVVCFFLYHAFFHDGIRWAVVLAAILAILPVTYLAIQRQKQNLQGRSGSLADHLRNSIASVQHQIGLLRSVLWWYLVPLELSAVLVFTDASLMRNGPAPADLYFAAKVSLFVLISALISFLVWKLNQRAVRNDLEPRVRELQKTLTELSF